MSNARSGVRDIEERFWHVEAAAGTLKSGQWRVEPADTEWFRHVRPLLTKGRRIPASRWPSPPPRFEYEKVASRPDVASTGMGPPQIVSSGLRAVMELLDPGVAQFHPARIDGPGRDSISPEFWVVNWLRIWNCQPDPTMPEIDPREIPPRQHIGVVSGRGSWVGGEAVCDSTFRAAAKQAGIIGLRFEPARLATGPRGRGHVRDAATGRRVAVERRCLPHEPHFDIDAFLRRFPGATYPDRVPDCNALMDYLTFNQGAGCSLRAIRLLLEAGYSPNTTSPIHSPIAVTVQPKSRAVLELLHRHGCDWNRPNMIGLTPLMSAAMDGEATAVRLLLEFGADPHARDHCGATALHYAAEGASCSMRPARGYLDTIGLLLEAGVSSAIRDLQGATAADRAATGKADDPAARRRVNRFLAKLATG